MFDGNYGSAEENCLEQKLDQLELQQGIIQVNEAARQLYIYILELQTKVKRRFAKVNYYDNCVGDPISRLLTVGSTQ